MSENILEIRDLTTAFLFDGKPIIVVENISFDVRKGEILGVVGESGSGKSVTAKTVMRLIPNPPGLVLGGQILYAKRDVLKMSEREMRHIRGDKISMIFQEPMTSLNPVYTCGSQIVEALTVHQNIPQKQARQRAVEMLSLVGIPMPEERLKSYPHELSGGMRQRVMIAMALCCSPELLIADEPTTALDPTIQAQILELIKELQQEVGMSVMYITHDLGVVAEICDRVVIMYAGMVMEIAPVRELFSNPLHPYTLNLFKAMLKLNERRETVHSIPGSIPHITEMPKGCRFQPRCSSAIEVCKHNRPELVESGYDHLVRCFNPS